MSVKRRRIRVIPLICGLVLVLAAFGIVGASPAWAKKHHAKHHAEPSARSESLYADIVMDASTGRIIHATNADARRHPASLTKMMTLYLTFQALEAGKITVDRRVPVSKHAAAQSPSKLGLRPRQTIRVGDAIMALITQSANDAAVVLAEALGGSESGFAAMMTRQAKALGMQQTVYYNASGLPNPRQYTSARDMAILGYALYAHYPKYYPLFSHSSFEYDGVEYHNHNHLMERYVGMDGIKTGYVRASGFNLVASAKRGPTRLIAAIFGGRSAPSRDRSMEKLLDASFAAMAQQGPLLRDNAGEPGAANRDVADARYLALPAGNAVVFICPKPGASAPVASAAPRPPMDRPAPASTASSPTPATAPQPEPLLKADFPEPNESEDEMAAANGKSDASPATVTAESAAVNWGIQIGAYSDEAVARQALVAVARSMDKLLGTAEPTLQKVVYQDKTTVFRARFMGMEEKNARSVCSYMVRHAQSCVVVAPEHTAD